MTKYCIEKNCNKQPTYNFINEKSAIFCGIHRQQDMVNIKHKKCKEENCNIFPSFNFKNQTPALYCQKHSKKNMIDIINKKCINENCDKQPAYNYENEKIKLYCSKHAKNNMLDIKNKKCLEKNCNIYPSFNYENEKVRIYCSEHAKNNMINIKNKRCLTENCYTIPNFNFENEKIGLYCSNHKKKDMVDVKSKKCLEKTCKKSATFNFENEKNAIYCSEHSKKDMLNIKSKRCLENNCDIFVTNKYKGYCFRCFLFKFPDELISRNYKVKEIHMTEFIKKQFKNEIMIFDKQTNGCSKRRPDCYIDKFTHVLIIECDENQHKDTSCENKRTMELFQDFGNRPIIFIRFNPDNYIKNGKKINSSFKIHKTLDVPSINKNEWERRTNVLNEKINYWLNVIPKKELTVEYLFYDDT